MNKAEKEITKNIDEHGCHVTSVFDPEEKDPNFTYTVGINRCEGKEELLILGLRHELAFWIANEYNRRVKAGENFVEGEFYEGFLEGFKVCFSRVAERYKKEFMLSCNWLYSGTQYPALQLIFPTVNGFWPWESEANSSFKKLQPSFQEIPAW